MSVLSEIAGGRGRAAFGLSVSFPGSNTQRFASHPFTSAGGGHYTGKVLSWGRLSYAISDRGGQIPAAEMRVRIADTDRTIARIVAGAYADTVRGSAAVVYLATPTVASGSWLTVFSGKLVKVSFPAPFVAELTLRVDDDQLQRLSPRGGWALTRQQWPNAKPEVFDSMAPVLYGVHDASQTRTGPGMVPTLYVDTVLWRYLVCAGKAKSIDRVYVDGVQTGSGWSTSYVTVSGRIWTLIDFTTDQAGAVITCDANGYESVGDGSGTTITEPAAILAHRLTNFCLGDYKTGSWLSTNALIDSTLLSAASTYLTSFAAKASVYSDTQVTGTEILAQFCRSFRMRCWWTLGGKIGIGYENIWALPYTGTRWRWYRDEQGEFALDEDDWQVTSRVLVRQAYDSAGGQYLSAFEVQDASVTTDTQDALDMAWSEAK